MITRYEEFINEEFNFIETSKKILKKIDDMAISVVDRRVAKYIQKKVEGMTDEEKLLEISKISDKISNKYFSLKNSFLFLGLSSLSMLATELPGFYQWKWNDMYVWFFVNFLYIKLNKKFRIVARDNYEKIREEYIKKYGKQNIEVDPFSEEEWHEKDSAISKSDHIMHRNRNNLEDFPFFGTGDGGPR